MNKPELILTLQNRWVTREELCELLQCNDTEARETIRDLNIYLKGFNRCVLSTAGRRGYHIPNPANEGEMKDARLVVAELRAKAKSINERADVIENFIYNWAELPKDESAPTLF